MVSTSHLFFGNDGDDDVDDTDDELVSCPWAPWHLEDVFIGSATYLSRIARTAFLETRSGVSSRFRDSTTTPWAGAGRCCVKYWKGTGRAESGRAKERTGQRKGRAGSNSLSFIGTSWGNRGEANGGSMEVLEVTGGCVRSSGQWRG